MTTDPASPAAHHTTEPTAGDIIKATADAWATTHGCRDIYGCSATPWQAFRAGWLAAAPPQPADHNPAAEREAYRLGRAEERERCERAIRAYADEHWAPSGVVYLALRTVADLLGEATAPAVSPSFDAYQFGEATAGHDNQATP